MYRLMLIFTISLADKHKGMLRKKTEGLERWCSQEHSLLSQETQV